MYDMESGPYTESDLPQKSWAVIRVTKPGDMYVYNCLRSWREITTGKQIRTVDLLMRINEEGWENRTGADGTYRKHVGFEVLWEAK